MTVTFNEVENIFKTLPIGYYLGRKIDIELEDGNAAYFAPMEDKIVIGYQIIAEAVKTLKNITDIEEAVRTLTYHEVSHALLTPKNLKMTNVINIFEDERIETLLNKFYLNTNFKRFVKLVNDFHNEAPKTADEFFYQIVRYRIGPKKFVNRVKELIEKYKSMNYFDGYMSGNYRDDVQAFYYEVADCFYYERHDKSESSKSSESSKASESPDSSKSSKPSESSKASESPDSSKSSKSSESIESFEDDITYNIEEVKELVNQALNVYDDNSLNEQIAAILLRMSKASARNGSAINSYSGVFDARSVVRQDYKYFVQKNRTGHIKAYNKTHLTLFIDRSGSFCPSEQIANKIIHALIKFEKQNPDFEFDLVTMGIGETLVAKDKRELKAGGGNALDKEIFEIFKQTQKSGCNNINIVLFDGGAFTDVRRHIDSYPSNFKAFNSSNTTIISDCSNETHIRKYCKSAKVIICSNYVQELQKQVVIALERLAR